MNSVREAKGAGAPTGRAKGRRDEQGRGLHAGKHARLGRRKERTGGQENEKGGRGAARDSREGHA